MRKPFSLLVYFFLGLVLFGLIIQLKTNPSNFITSVLILLGISFIIYIILTAVINKRNVPNDPDAKKYQAAVKQSQEKYGKAKKPKKTIKKTSTSKQKRKKRNHLKVIDGNKKDQEK